MVVKRTSKSGPTGKAPQEEDVEGSGSVISRVNNISITQISAGRLKNQTADAQQEELEQEKHDSEEKENANLGLAGILGAIFLKPFDSDFNLNTYNKSDKYRKYRDMDDEDRRVASMYDKDGKYQGNAGRGIGYHVNPMTAGAATVAATLGTVGAVEVRARQKAFFDRLPEAEEKSGVPAKFIGAMWGNESAFGTKLVSTTGCLGDGHFTRGTFAVIIRQYGDQIPGMEKYAVGLRNGTIKPDDAELQAQRLKVESSPAAMGFLAAEIARDLKVDPRDEKNWGLMYAAYTVGPAAAKKLKANIGNDQSAMALLGDVAEKNPMFYDKGRANSAQALANYQSVIMNSAKSFDKQIVAKLGTDNAIAVASASSKDAVSRETASVASTISGPAIKSDTNARAGFSDAKFDAKAKEAADAAVKTAQGEMTLFERMKTKVLSYGFADEEPAAPAPKVALEQKKPLVALVYG